MYKCNSAANGFMDDLVFLLTSRRAEEHKLLLTWIVQVLYSVPTVQ